MRPVLTKFFVTCTLMSCATWFSRIFYTYIETTEIARLETKQDIEKEARLETKQDIEKEARQAEEARLSEQQILINKRNEAARSIQRQFFVYSENRLLRKLQALKIRSVPLK